MQAQVAKQQVQGAILPGIILLYAGAKSDIGIRACACECGQDDACGCDGDYDCWSYGCGEYCEHD